MAWPIFSQIYESFTSGPNELLIMLIIMAMIFFIVYDIMVGVARFNKGASLVIAIAVAAMAVFSGLTTKAMQFVYAFGSAGFIVILAGLIIFAFAAFALRHLGVRVGRR